MRKMWAAMIPGHDPKADSIFHYHQEVPKYLRGWHQCSKEDATRLAALICRVKIADNKKFSGDLTVHNLPSLKDLVPKDMTGSMLDREWKKVLIIFRTVFAGLLCT